MSTRKLMSASLANLLIPLSGLLVSPFLSRELGPDGRGLYAALTLPIVVCGWIGTFGLQDALSLHLRDGRLSRRLAVRVSLIATVPLGLLGVALLAVLGLVVFAGDGARYGQFLILSLLAPLHILANLVLGALTGASDIRGVNQVKVVPALLRTVAVIVACVAFDLDAYGAGLLFLVSVVAGLARGLHRLRSAPAQSPAPGSVPTRSLVTYSLTCLPGVLAAISSARLDQIIGLPVIGARELGYYAVAVSVAEIPMVIATAARTVLMGRPATSEARQSTRVARLAVLVSVLACGLLAATAVVAVPLVFGRAFAPAVLPTIILCAGTILYTCVLILSSVLLVNDRPGWSSTALVSGSVVGLALLFLLAPLGAVGAAVASLAGYGMSVIVATWAVRRMAGMRSLRMLTVPYREDVAFVRDAVAVRIPAALRGRPAWSRVPAGLRVRAAVRRADVGTIAVGLLIVLAWLRILVPQLIQLVSTGRPEFNARDVTEPAAAELAGNALSLAFVGLAVVIAVSGPARRWPDRLGWLAVLIAPLAAIALATTINGDRPGIVALALPLAALAIWLRPLRSGVLATFGMLGGVTAAGSILLALIRPDLALISGEAAGAKDGFLGGLLVGPYLHSNMLGIALALSTPFVFCVGNTLLRRGSMVVLLVALAWTGSRSSQLAVAVVLLTYPLIRRFTRRTWPLAVPAAAGLALVVLVPLVTRDPEAFTRRGRIWTVLLRQWTERPILGWGPGHFQRPHVAAEIGGQFNHAHNVLVHLLVVGGLVAVVLLGLLGYLVWRQSVVLARAGMPAAALFLIVLGHLSWLEASHLATTLAGYAAWLPLMLIARLGLDLSPRRPDPRRPRPGRQTRAWPAAQRISVSRR